MSNSPDPSHHRNILPAALAAGLFSFLLLLATSTILPIVWDEGNAIARSDGILRWITTPDAWNATGIERHWRYTTQIEGHPAFYGIVIAAGRLLAPPFFTPLTAARFGPMLLFGIAVGALYWRVARDVSTIAAMSAVIALLLLPRMFAHSHFASIDGPLVSCWILAWAAFPAALKSWRGGILWGILLGMTLSTKATGWLAVPPFVLWAIAYRDRTAIRAVCIGIPTALIAFLIFNPPLWPDPLNGILAFLRMNLHRRELGGLNIAILFLRRMYNLDYPLPWWNTLFWVGIVVPVPILAAALAGIVRTVRHFRTDRFGMLVFFNWAILLAARAIPGTPVHDGIRLFLPSFAFLAIFAGMGTDQIIQWASLNSLVFKRMAHATVGLAAVLMAANLAWYAPQWLSHYNLLIGGLPGATAAGMEPTYYWDGLDASTLDWLNTNTTEGEKVRFGASSPYNRELLRRWDVLRPDTRDDAPGRFQWYVIQNRPSGLGRADRDLLKSAKPVFTKKIRHGGWGPWRLDVPMVWVFDEERQKAGGRRQKGQTE